jgi:dTDP-L-rhamnose 4-epimerase
MKRILVTGGAGLIGSHTVDLLLTKGYDVRILDNLERPTHMGGKPDYLSPDAEFLRGDVRNTADLTKALSGVDGVIHLAATGGFTPRLSRYFDCNSLGTAHLLESMQQMKRPVERIVVASSVGIYGEGRYMCPEHGLINGVRRSVAQLAASEWEMTCPICGAVSDPAPTDEEKIPSPEKAYSISKFDEECLVLGHGRDFDVHACALRYFLTYGPRQSLTNPYTGVIAIFSSRILNDMRPMIFEDGNQSRDFVYVTDVARATVMALENDDARGRVFNVGTGQPTKISAMASLLAHQLNKSEVQPELTGLYRPGESRHIYAGIEEIGKLGFAPSVKLEDGLKEAVEWIQSQGQVKEYLSGAMAGLQRSSVVRGGAVEVSESETDSLSVVLPSYNEAGNLETMVHQLTAELEKFSDDFEIVIVNDGSRDGTGFIADRLAGEDQRVEVVHHPFNIGYGGAQKSGFKYATKKWAVVVPADHQFDAADLEKFLEDCDDADIVSSYRIERRDPWVRRFVSSFYNRYMRLAYGVTLKDLNWVKMFRRTIFDKIDIETHGFAVDAEIVVKALDMGFRVKQIPVTHYARTWGNPTGVNLGNLYRTGMELLRIRGMLNRMRKQPDKE